MLSGDKGVISRAVAGRRQAAAAGVGISYTPIADASQEATGFCAAACGNAADDGLRARTNDVRLDRDQDAYGVLR